MRQLRVCGWNVHACVGTDGRRDAGRVARVLAEIDADVVGLQEVHADERRGGEDDQARFLSDATGMQGVAGPTLERRGGRYGNLVLSRLPVRDVRRHDLSVRGREPRGAIELSLEAAPNARLRVVATHLGLASRERAWQARRLLQELLPGPGEGETLLVLADWNEWVPWGRALRLARARFGHQPAPPTFPSVRPVLALDRVWVSPRHALVDVAAHRGGAARRASDHLPLVAGLALADLRPCVDDRPAPPRGTAPPIAV